MKGLTIRIITEQEVRILRRIVQFYVDNVDDITGNSPEADFLIWLMAKLEECE